MSTTRLARARPVACLAALAVLAGTAACGAEVERVPVVTEEVFDDPFDQMPRERLPVVVRASTYLPRSLEVVRVTDLDQVRERLGASPLGPDGPAPGASPPPDLWSRADEEAALLTGGLLRPRAGRLERDYGFGPDDVLWEAIGEDADGDLRDGWVLALHRRVDLAAVQRAADDGVGVLAGGRVLPERRVVLGGSARRDAKDSWRETRALVGAGTQRTPESVYLRAGCVPLGRALTAGPARGGSGGAAGTRRVARVREAHELDDYEPVEAVAVVFADRVATARLGMADFGAPRADLVERADLAETWPRPPAGTPQPAFGDAFGHPVVDPSTGRVGFPVRDPAAAVALTRDGVLPYAVCPEE